MPVLHFSRDPDELAQDLRHLGDFPGRPHVRIGDGLDQRHAQAVGLVDTAVPAVAHLPAGILLEAKLADADPAVLVGDPAVRAQDGRSLEAGGDAAVEVLLPGDVELAHDIAAEEQGHFEGDVERLLVELEGRRIVHLVGADVLGVELVNDLFVGLEFHEGGAVVLAELGEGRAHMAQHLRVVSLVVLAGRAAAEQLLTGVELLVDLEAGLEPQPGIVFFPELPVIEDPGHG